MKRFFSGVILILMVSLLLPLNIVSAQPAPPQVFYGNATLDGSPAPDGTTVTAELDSVLGFMIVNTTLSNGDGSYSLQLPESGSGDYADNGKAVLFYINGLSAGSSTFAAGIPTELDLSATSPITQYTLTVNSSTGGNATGTGTYDEGTTANINATPLPGWEFSNWTGDVLGASTSASNTVLMDADKTVTANFAQLPQYTLTVDSSAGGSTSPSGGSTRYEGEVVSVTAIPGVGYQFDSWTGDVASPNAASTTVTMDADKTITANFVTAPDVTLTMAVNGNGTTTPEPGDTERQANEVVSITAIPDDGYVFVNWTGAVANANAATTTVLMDADKTVTANFALAGQVTLTITVNGNGSTTGAGTYDEGTVVSITATPDFGWSFDGWTGNVTNPNSASTTVTMDADKTITANFVAGGDITPPVISSVTAGNITRNGADITWTTNEPGDSQVDYAASPGQLTPLDGTMVTQHLVRLTGLSPFTPYSYTVMSRDAAGNLKTSSVFTFTTLGTPASFSTSDWTITLADVEGGKDASISYTITNSGDIGGVHQITLSVNGETEDSKELTLDAQGSQQVSFSFTRIETGTYQVTVDGLSFSFAVTDAAGGGINWWLIGGLLLAMLVVIAIVLFPRIRELIPSRAPAAAPAQNLAQAAAAARARMAMPPAPAPTPAVAPVTVPLSETLAKAPSINLTVTALAAEKLKEAIQAQTKNPNMAVRLLPASSPTDGPKQFEMTLDSQKEGDQVIYSEGVKILLLGPNVAPDLDGMTVDSRETPQGVRFSISRPAPGA